MSDAAAALIAKIDDRTAKVVVVGQGYVGLPVAMRAVEVGFPVVGYDIAPARVDALAAGRSYVEDVTDEQLAPRSRPATGRPATPTICATSTSRSSPCRRRCATASPTSRSSRPPRATSRAWLTPGRARRARVDDVSRHDRGAAAPDPRGVGPARPAATSSSATRPSASTPATREWTFVNTPKVVSGHRRRVAVGRRGVLRRARRQGRAGRLHRRGRAGEAAREHVPAREHRARQRARDVRPRPRRRHLVGDRRGRDQAVRLHALHARARASAATACRSTRRISRGASSGSSASGSASSSSPTT